MKNLKNKVRYSLGIFGLVLFSIMISLILIVIIRNANDSIEINEKIEESEDITELKEKVNNAIKDYPYSILVIDSQSYIKGVENDYSQYVITAEKDNVYKSYMFRNADTAIYQCWDKNDSGKIDLFIYSDEFDVWVETEMDEEPMVSNVWSITEGMENYEISDELGYWGNDECIVLHTFKETEVWSTVYEELYIRKSDYIPLGIICYSISNSVGFTEGTINPADYEFGTIEEGTIETRAYNELVTRYDIGYSMEPQHLFLKPEKTITGSQYTELEQKENLYE